MASGIAHYVLRSLIAVAERLNLTTIATFNHRDFTVFRPAHTDAFELIPASTPR